MQCQFIIHITHVILCRNQQQWINDLLQHVTFSRIAHLITAVKNSENMIMVSDGSSKDYKMTYA